MKGLICAALIFCVFVAKGDENEGTTETIEEDGTEVHPGDEVLLSDLPEKERDQYERYLKEGVEAYNETNLTYMYNRRYVNETTRQMGKSGHFKMNFITNMWRCRLRLHVVHNADGTERVIPEKKLLSLFRLFRCKVYVWRKELNHFRKNFKKKQRNAKKLLSNVIGRRRK